MRDWVDELPEERRIKLVPFDKIKLGTDRAYLVKNLIPRVGLTVIWGPPKSGKSFFAFDLAMHVALGWEYRGRRIHQGPIVYCAFEGQSGIKPRVEAFRQYHLAEHADAVPFYIVPAIMDLAKDHADLIKAISTETTKPVAVVLDTLNRSIGGSENNDQDMGAYIKAADTIRSTFNCAVIIVHHCGVTETRPRGHTSLTGAADAQLAVKRDATGTITVEVEWMKDGSGEGDVIACKLDQVEVGIDQDGDVVSSCVLLVAEKPLPPPRGAKLSDNQRTMLNILHDAAAAGLTLDEWNTKAKAEGIGVNRKATLFDIRKVLHDRQLVHSYADRWYVTAG